MLNKNNIISLIITSIKDTLNLNTDNNIDKNNRKSSHGKDVKKYEEEVDKVHVAYYKNTSF